MVQPRRIVTWGALVILLAIVAGAGAAQAPERAPQGAPPAVWQQPVCWAPLLLLGIVVVVLAGTRFYFWTQHQCIELDEHRAQAALLAVHVLQQQARVADLSLGPDGQVVPRILTDATGRLAIVSPGILTRPIQALDVDAETDSEQLRAAALVAHAMSRSAGGPGSGDRAGGSREWMAWLAGAQALSFDERVPQQVRILDAAEVASLDEQGGAG